MKPLVIVPTYNERENIAQLIPKVLAADTRLHILVVDDSSPDGTGSAVEELRVRALSERVFLETRLCRMGLGAAYIHGFRWGLAHGYDFLIQMDADWSHHPAYLSEMLRLSTAVDFVVGSRYVEGGGTKNWGWGRRLLSRFGSLYSSLILNLAIRDLTGGFNGWRLAVLEAIGLDSLRSDGYSFQIELKLRASRLGFRPAEFPIIFAERRAGQSKMSAGIVCEAIWRVWQFRRFREIKTQEN
ncbi:MAG: polyprenol monophosphomannose synthase [Acidobacteria bacterium]|nr:polyprenol monophosphomannose synthase [Acidobacteriota bacterium]